MKGSLVAERLEAVRARIARAGGDPDGITIVAVTKGFGLSACEEALAAGIRDLGENRVQEALPKVGALPGADWHLIGHLQSNKVRQAAGRFRLIQAVDDLKLAEAIAQRASRQPVLLEVNVALEPQKHGAAPDQAVELAGRIGDLLPLQGLMGIAPLGGDPRPAFDALARLRAEAEQRWGRPLPVLSMGMSADFEAAVASGATMLRLGRVLFGNR